MTKLTTVCHFLIIQCTKYNLDDSQAEVEILGNLSFLSNDCHPSRVVCYSPLAKKPNLNVNRTKQK